MVYFPTPQGFCTSLPCKTDKGKNCIFLLNVLWLWSQCRKLAANVTCYQTLWVTISSFSSTCSAPAHRARDTIELLQRETSDVSSPELWPQQFGSEPRWLQDVGSHAAACVRDADPQCRRTQAATGWRLEQSAVKCCRRCCQQVKKASVGASSREVRILRTSAVGCFDNRMKLSIDSLCIMCFEVFN